MTSRRFRLFLPAVFLLVLSHAYSAATGRPNVLIITADDLSCDSVGVYGSKLKDTTPHMDRPVSVTARNPWPTLRISSPVCRA
jgi:hypothetical protein